MNIVSPTNPGNFARKLKNFIRQRKDSPVMPVSAAGVDLRRELAREARRKAGERGVIAAR